MGTFTVPIPSSCSSLIDCCGSEGVIASSSQSLSVTSTSCCSYFVKNFAVTIDNDPTSGGSYSNVSYTPGFYRLKAFINLNHIAYISSEATSGSLYNGLGDFEFCDLPILEDVDCYYSLLNNNDGSDSGNIDGLVLDEWPKLCIYINDVLQECVSRSPTGNFTITNSDANNYGFSVQLQFPPNWDVVIMHEWECLNIPDGSV